MDDLGRSSNRNDPILVASGVRCLFWLIGAHLKRAVCPMSTRCLLKTVNASVTGTSPCRDGSRLQGKGSAQAEPRNQHEGNHGWGDDKTAGLEGERQGTNDQGDGEAEP